jgi:alkanesulfonate monooxygenase SsuD/methylene tetrahydromethanopterin reductase-like flavin-dependent oxidoreductase (luciferase family)
VSIRSLSRKRRTTTSDFGWAGALGNTSCLVGTAEQVADAILRYYRLGELEGDRACMPDDPGTDLDQASLQARQRPSGDLSSGWSVL